MDDEDDSDDEQMAERDMEGAVRNKCCCPGYDLAGMLAVDFV